MKVKELKIKSHKNSPKVGFPVKMSGAQPVILSLGPGSTGKHFIPTNYQILSAIPHVSWIIVLAPPENASAWHQLTTAVELIDNLCFRCFLLKVLRFCFWTLLSVYTTVYVKLWWIVLSCYVIRLHVGLPGTTMAHKPWYNSGTKITFQFKGCINLAHNNIA